MIAARAKVAVEIAGYEVDPDEPLFHPPQLDERARQGKGWTLDDDG